MRHGHDQRHHHDDDQQDGEVHDHDRGLAFDLGTLLARRDALKLLASAGLAGTGLFALVGCGGGSASTATAAADSAAGASTTSAASSTTVASSAASTAAAAADCVTAIPEETAGPYPGDGSNGVNVLAESGIVRSDIRSSFGGASGVAAGVPLQVELTIVGDDGCTPRADAAVYLWHCTIDGEYSLYSEAVKDENYLRGVQATAADGKATFTTIFPACYSGRWPHIHFEVYDSVETATAAGDPLATSQVALPQETCATVYASAGYEASVANLARVSLTSDNVFGDDGGVHELATMSGSVADGYVARLTVGA